MSHDDGVVHDPGLSRTYATFNHPTDMINIPTPETDNCARVYEAAGMPAAHRALVKERDQLRKVVDELANIIYFHSLRPQNALDGYNQLPHIQERETK